MAYDHGAIVQRVVHALERQPRLGIGEIARQLGLDRHTISRALQLRCASTFTELKERLLQRRLEELATDGRIRSRKDLAASFGCSPRTLARRRDRSGS
jgi:AraC-like DNA-binding protein